MLPGISTSMAGPDAGSASSGEKTLRSVTQTESSADSSKTPLALEPRDIQPLEIDLMVSSDAETQPTKSKATKHSKHTSGYHHYHGSHAGSGTGATAADTHPVPSTESLRDAG